jgi:hypothetical protein
MFFVLGGVALSAANVAESGCGSSDTTGRTGPGLDAAASDVAPPEVADDGGSDARADADSDADPDATTAFPCGALSCNPATEYCEYDEPSGGSPIYSCVDPSAPANGSSSGGPLTPCSPTDCPCIINRALQSRCTGGGATCTLDGGHAYVAPCTQAN